LHYCQARRRSAVLCHAVPLAVASATQAGASRSTARLLLTLPRNPLPRSSSDMSGFGYGVGYQQSVVPHGLPKLVGNGYKDPTRTNFAKSHMFDVHAGIPSMRDPPAMAAPRAPPGGFGTLSGSNITNNLLDNDPAPPFRPPSHA